MLTSDVIFWLAVFLLTVIQLGAIHLRNTLSSQGIIYFGLMNVIAIALLITSWTLRKFREKYWPDYQKDYRSGYITGRVVGGAVYVDDPHNTPGLGWLP